MGNSRFKILTRGAVYAWRRLADSVWNSLETLGCRMRSLHRGVDGGGGCLSWTTTALSVLLSAVRVQVSAGWADGFISICDGRLVNLLPSCSFSSWLSSSQPLSAWIIFFPAALPPPQWGIISWQSRQPPPSLCPLTPGSWQQQQSCRILHPERRVRPLIGLSWFHPWVALLWPCWNLCEILPRASALAAQRDRLDNPKFPECCSLSLQSYLVLDSGAMLCVTHTAE